MSGVEDNASMQRATQEFIVQEEVGFKDLPTQPDVDTNPKDTANDPNQALELGSIIESVTTNGDFESIQAEKLRLSAIGIAELWNDPIRSAAIRQRMSDAKKRNWQNPEYRRKMIDSRKEEWKRRKNQPPKNGKVTEMSPGQTYIPQPIEIISGKKIDTETMELWEYAVKNDLLGKILENGYFTEDELNLLSLCFKANKIPRSVKSLLDRFSIAVACEG